VYFTLKIIKGIVKILLSPVTLLRKAVGATSGGSETQTEPEPEG